MVALNSNLPGEMPQYVADCIGCMKGLWDVLPAAGNTSRGVLSAFIITSSVAEKTDRRPLTVKQVYGCSRTVETF